MSNSKKIILKSSDGETFKIKQSVAMASQMIKHMIEDGCADSEIPLPNVTGAILARVLEYCKKHIYAAVEKEKEKDSSSSASASSSESDSHVISLVFCALESIQSALGVTTNNNIPKQLCKEEVPKHMKKSMHWQEKIWSLASTPAVIPQNDIGDDDNDDEPLNEDDDDNDLDDVGHGEELNTQHLVLAQFDKVTRIKSKWKCTLKDGIMHKNNKDFLFNKATVEFDF